MSRRSGGSSGCGGGGPRVRPVGVRLRPRLRLVLRPSRAVIRNVIPVCVVRFSGDFRAVCGAVSPAPPRVHRPVPAGVAPLADPEVEPVAAPPDPVLSGELADEVAAEAVRQEREATPPVPVVDGSPSGGHVPRRAVNGLPAVPPSPPPSVRSVPAPAARSPVAASDDARIVLSGGAGALVERLLQAMADSRVQVDAVRRVWIEADGLVGGWDLWALDPAVADRVRQLQRVRER